MSLRLLSPFLALAVVAAAVLAAGLGAPARAQAQSAGIPAFVLYGEVAGSDGAVPSRVRATIGETVCGTAEVVRAGADKGFYVMVVASESTRAGCGVEGAAVRVHLASGLLDDGVGGTQVLFRPGAAQRLDLSTVAVVSGGEFLGLLPAGPGYAVLRWTGSSGVPVAQAVATIPRAVEAVYFWDVSRQEFRSYTPGAPAAEQTYTLVDADDIVFVRVK